MTNKKYFYFYFPSFCLIVSFFIFVGKVSAEGGPTLLSVSISKEGVVEPFSVACQNASSTNATALLLNGPSENQTIPFQYSLYGYMRRPCINGVVNFDSFNIVASVVESAGQYPAWLQYFRMPLNLVVKDTTNLYAPDAPIYHQIVNLNGAFNNYTQEVFRIENEDFKTLGYGSSFSIDEDQVWRNVTKGGQPFGNSSVLFLPGLEASRLYMKEINCILNCEDQLWEPNTPNDVRELELTDSGYSINDIYTKDIIDETNTPIELGSLGINIYKSLIQKLDSIVSTTTEEKSIKEWKPFAYDWRYPVDDVVSSVKYENDQVFILLSILQNMADRSDNGKVSIIAHSNGGLLARSLVERLKRLKLSKVDLIDKIDKIIFIGTPHIGTPSGLFAILHGYDQKLPFRIMSESQARQLAKNMPSAYGLIPSPKYYNLTSIKYPAKFQTTKYSDIFGDTLDSYQEQKDFLLGLDGRSAPSISDIINPIIGNYFLLNKSEVLHQSLDNIEIPSHIRVINIAGWGKDTLAGLEYLDNDIKPIYTYKGDKTVVLESALYDNDGRSEKYWLDLSNSKIEHKNITEDKTILSFLENIITKNNSTELSTSEPINTKTKLRLSVHSPINIGVYDSEGNFTGKTCDINSVCQIKEDIPGSTYFEIGEGKYVNVKEEHFKVTKLEGTGVGTFTYIQEKVLPDQSTITLVFKDIPVTVETKAEVSLNQQNVLEMKLDTNNDGVVDVVLKPTNSFDPISFLLVMKQTIQNFDIGKNRKMVLARVIDNTIKLIQDGKIDKAKLKSENFKKRMEKIVSNKEGEIRKNKKISKEDALKIITMLEELLFNLN